MELNFHFVIIFYEKRKERRKIRVESGFARDICHCEDELIYRQS